MSSRARLSTLAFAFAFLAAGCGDDGEGGGGPPPSPTPTPRPAPRVVIEFPMEGLLVDDFSFGVRVVLEPAGFFDPESLDVRLNGESLATEGGPSVFVATVNPGPPLRANNQITASARDREGIVRSVSNSFRYVPPGAYARRITSEADLIGGPLAHGRVGDYLLGNTKARFIIQDAGQRDLWSVGTFGGNLIDAELLSSPGRDNFLEIQPMLNIETVLNAQTVEIVNDGEDGTAAIIRTCGPDDLLDFVNPSTIIEGAGLNFPDSADDADYEIDACTDYILEPGKNYVRMVTTVVNGENRNLGLFVGDWLNPSGELELWARGPAGIGELLANSVETMSFIGYGDAAGIEYSHTTIPIEGSPIPGSTFFATAGVAVVLQSHSILEAIFGRPPTFVVPAGGSHSFTRFFGVSGANGGTAVDIENEVKGIASGVLRGCVTVGSERGSRVRVSAGKASGGRINELATVFVTDARGCFEGTLPVGSYVVAAARTGTPFEGGGPTPFLHEVRIAADTITTLDIALPATGRLRVQVMDQNDEPVPARITVVGFDPSPEPAILVEGPLGTETTGVFNDITFDSMPFGVARSAYAGADGIADIEIEPGPYHLYVSRGVEYSLFDMPITVVEGETTQVSARIARVIDTSGFVSSDFHVHGINSADSKVKHVDRALQFAGEGVDNIVMTDHHAHTDLNPTIVQLGLQKFVHATISEEITTWDYGHFNAYPLTIDPNQPSGGSTDWAGAAPPGEDFPSKGSYSLTPAEIAQLATEGPRSTADTVIQINHIDSHFAPLRINTLLVPPQSLITAEEKLRFRLDPGTGNLYHHFPALELWNGSRRSDQNKLLVERLGIWFNLLNQGLFTTMIADTDTHKLTNLETSGARTWTAASSDAPAEIDVGEVARSVAAGKATCGQGPYVQARLLAGDGSGATADLTLNGLTLVTSANGSVDLEIRIQSPLWAEYDRIEIYANAETTVTAENNGVPVLFSATPARVLNRNAGCEGEIGICPPDAFGVRRMEVAPEIPGAERLETNLRINFSGLVVDTWFVVIVKGTDGVSRPMFPVFVGDLPRNSNRTLQDLTDGNLGEGGVLALAVTNPLYADVDGVPGFQAPWLP